MKQSFRVCSRNLGDHASTISITSDYLCIIFIIYWNSTENHSALMCTINGDALTKQIVIVFAPPMTFSKGGGEGELAHEKVKMKKRILTSKYVLKFAQKIY